MIGKVYQHKITGNKVEVEFLAYNATDMKLRVVYKYLAGNSLRVKDFDQFNNFFTEMGLKADEVPAFIPSFPSET